jgi:hypothetical protein
LRYSDRANEVRPKVALDGFETSGRGRPVTLGGYASIVNENVQAAEIRVDSPGSSGDGGRIIEIDRNVADIQVFRCELHRRFFTQGLVRRADQNGAARDSESACHLIADTLVRPVTSPILLVVFFMFVVTA